MGIHRTNSGWSGPSATSQVADLVTVGATSIDDFALGAAPEGVSIIKIDTEGAESSVIEGAIETIRKFGPTLVVEINRNFQTISDLLDDIISGTTYGYKAFLPSQDGFLTPLQRLSEIDKEANDLILIPDRLQIRE